MLVRNESDWGSACPFRVHRATLTARCPLPLFPLNRHRRHRSACLKRPTSDSARVSPENLMDYGFQIFNLASTFANGNPNFVELLRVQSVDAIIPWRD